MQKIIFSLFLFILSCSTPPKDTSIPQPTHPKSTPEIDIESLKIHLGMYRDLENLGYEEKQFDSCLLTPPPLKCGNQTLSVLHFRLQCRDSMGTVNSVTQMELLPVTSNHIRWKVGSIAGSTKTDNDGYGRVQFISPTSSKNVRLSLTHKTNSLGLTISETKRIIVPRDWCD